MVTRYNMNSMDPDDKGQVVMYDDYKKLHDNLMKILTCFAETEGTWFERTWESYGISKEDAEQINKDWKEYYDSPNTRQ